MVLAPMMGASAFGEAVQPTYTPQAGGPAFQLDGVFDNAFQADLLVSDGMPEFMTVNPVLGVRLSQFPAGAPPLAGDRVQIASVGVTYFVNGVKPDGHGYAKLELTKSAPS